jgi:hypothetical protein
LSKFFSEKKTTITFLAYLPDAVKDKLLFESIEYKHDVSFEELATYFSDLFGIQRFKTKKVQVSLLLLEHKSMVDTTLFQVLDEISSDLHRSFPNIKEVLKVITALLIKKKHEFVPMRYSRNEKWELGRDRKS